MAVEMACHDLPDIIILGRSPTQAHGFGVLEALRSDPKTKNTRVVIISNYSRREMGDRVAKLGVLDHLIKTGPLQASWPPASNAS